MHPKCSLSITFSSPIFKLFIDFIALLRSSSAFSYVIVFTSFSVMISSLLSIYLTKILLGLVFLIFSIK